MRAGRTAAAAPAAVVACGAGIAAAFAVALTPVANRHSSARAGGGDAPVDLRGPRPITIGDRYAQFTWHAAPHGRVVGFLCRLDRHSFRRCHSGVRYGPLTLGRHDFTVVAVDSHRGRSRAAIGNNGPRVPSWSWLIERSETLRISGDVGAALYPGGKPRPIDLTLRDPHPFPLRVRQLTVAVSSVSAPAATRSMPCGPADFRVRDYEGPDFLTRAGSSSLRRDHVPLRRWPTVEMLDLVSNQDGCKGAIVHFAYGGLAGKARPSVHAVARGH